MAIRRCPYCKAIIDEQDKYCNNCGTQLLFPEDEFVEEEIPGDKIVDEPEKEEAEELEEREEPDRTDSSEDEAEAEENKAGGGQEEEEEEEEAEEEGRDLAAADDEAEDEEEEDKEKETEEGQEVEEEEKEQEKEEEAEEEEEEEEQEETGETGEKEKDSEKLEEPEKEPGQKDEDLEDIEEELELEAEVEEDEEEELGEEAEIEALTGKMTTTDFAPGPKQADDSQKKYKVSIEEDELVFRTKDLDNLTGTVEEGKEKLEEFLSSFQKGKAKAVTPHDVPALFQEGEETGSTAKETLPPWARGMKEEPPQPAGLEKSEEPPTETGTGAAATTTHTEWTTDSGIGIPEKITQAALPFGTDAVPARAGDRETVAREEEEFGPALRGRPGLSLKLKSKVVDLVFITALWLITLWFTAQVIGVSFLRLIVGSPVPVLALYFILLLLYFFLFLYFLGETLGDHYFSEED